MTTNNDFEINNSKLYKLGFEEAKSQATKEVLEDLDIINNLIRSHNYSQAGNHCIRLKQQLKKLGEGK